MQQLLRHDGTVVGKRHPDADGQPHCRAVHVEGSDERRSDPPSDQVSMQRTAKILAHDHELVASQPSERVTGPHQAGKPISDRYQLSVADPMSVGVVDVLEAVDIENATATV